VYNVLIVSDLLARKNKLYFTHDIIYI